MKNTINIMPKTKNLGTTEREDRLIGVNTAKFVMSDSKRTAAKRCDWRNQGCNFNTITTKHSITAGFRQFMHDTSPGVSRD